MTRCLLQAFSVLILGTAIFTGSTAVWITGKAWLAQHLLHISWQTSLQQHISRKPWQWADVSTVARLSLPGRNTALIVLSDASGEALAFGPGLVSGNPLHADSETVALGGHRDTHLAFLEHLPVGAMMELETIDGSTYRYRLNDKQIVDTRWQTLGISPDTPGLVLITCYPFNAIKPGGPLRLFASATLVGDDESG